MLATREKSGSEIGFRGREGIRTEDRFLHRRVLCLLFIHAELCSLFPLKQGTQPRDARDAHAGASSRTPLLGPNPLSPGHTLVWALGPR